VISVVKGSSELTTRERFLAVMDCQPEVCTLAQGKTAIERELEKAEALLSQGGYVPMADHLVPPDVPWESFVYYRDRLAAMAACGR